MARTWPKFQQTWVLVTVLTYFSKVESFMCILFSLSYLWLDSLYIGPVTRR